MIQDENSSETTSEVRHDVLDKVVSMRREYGGTFARAALTAGVRLRPAEVEFLLAREGKSGALFTPRMLRALFSELVAIHQVKRVLVIGPGNQDLACALATSHATVRITASATSAATVELVGALEGNEQVRWLQEDTPPATETFDLVLGCLPFGVRSHSGSDIADEIVKNAATALADGGSAYCACAPQAWWGTGRRGWLRALDSDVLNVDSLVALPAGTFRPMTSIPATLFKLTRRPSTELVHVAQLPSALEQVASFARVLALAESDRQQALVFARKSELTTVEHYILRAEIEHLAKARGLNLLKLGMAFESVTHADELMESDDRTLFLPDASVTAPACRRPTDNGSRYLRCVVDERSANADFVVEFLNSDLGMKLRALWAGPTKTIRPSLNLLEQPLYLPPMEVQEEAGALLGVANTALNKVVAAKELLRREPRRYKKVRETLLRMTREEQLDEWLNTIPFPLASVLWSAHVASTDEAKARTLVHFFEAAVQLHAVILMTAFSRGIASSPEAASLSSHLKDRGKSLQRPDFGTWREVAAYLSKWARRSLHDNAERDAILAAFAGVIADDIAGLANKDFAEIFDRANGVRNGMAHGGATNQIEAKALRNELERLVSRYRDAAGNTWASLGLYKFESMSNDEEEHGFRARGRSLIGVRTPFPSCNLLMAHPPKTGRLSLYIVSSGANNGLRLFPFIQIGTAPSGEDNACYFFSRADANQARYVAYHLNAQSSVDLPLERDLSTFAS